MEQIILGFDVYGTLINTSGVLSQLREFLPGKAEDFDRLWREKQLEYSFRLGLAEDFRGFAFCTQAALEFVNQKSGSPLNELQQELLLDTYKSLPAFEDVKPGLEELSKGNFRLFAFSNGSIKAINNLLQHARIDRYFENSVSVEAVRNYKPSPEVYRYFMEFAGGTKDNTWLVSGNSFDIIGAKTFGMKAACLNRNRDKTLDPFGFSPDLEVSELSELSKITNSGN